MAVEAGGHHRILAEEMVRRIDLMEEPHTVLEVGFRMVVVEEHRMVVVEGHHMVAEVRHRVVVEGIDPEELHKAAVEDSLVEEDIGWEELRKVAEEDTGHSLAVADLRFSQLMPVTG